MDTKVCTRCKQNLLFTNEFFPWRNEFKQKLDGRCKACSKAYADIYRKKNVKMLNEKGKSYRENNTNKIKESRKKHYKKNKDAITKSNEQWRKANKEKVREFQRIWRQNHPEIFRASRRRRRIKEKNIISTPYTESQVISTYGINCNICGLAIDFNAPRQTGKKGWENGLHIDHLIPISKYGPDTLENVRPTHGLCNIKKSSKIVY